MAYKHLMHELKVSEPSAEKVLPHLRQRQIDLNSDSVQSSYVDNSYVDESLHSPSVEAGMSSVKKQRKQRILPGNSHHDRDHPRHPTTPLYSSLKRSNSEVYIKDTSMQNDEEALFLPIMYAMEASQLSIQQSTEAAKIRIDQSQLNNLTRYVEANNSARRFGNGPDSNGTFQINNTLYN